MTGYEYPWSEKKSGKKYFFKVRTLSGNFVIRNKLKVREKSGNLERKSQGKVREF